jgi:uncharacterized protein (TIGR03067 family)
MKKIILLLLLLSPLYVLAQDSRLTGKWTGQDHTGKTGVFIFDADGYATTISGRDTIGGRGHKLDDVLMIMRYETGCKDKPCTIDLILYGPDGTTELSRLKGIYKFESGKLILSVSFETAKDRPANFDSEEDTIVLEKVE